ncbi:MAG: aminoacyl-histidine dipeptidase [Clostridiales bacterium]|nr:aminoacyl-histidine dipeptidase [Clostridiales bacterium]
MQNAEKVIEFFKEICDIPHASYDEKRIGDYLVDFAEKRGLSYRRDGIGNVLIKKPASIKGCNAPAVIIQGHMDMVYVRESDCPYTYEEGIKLIEEDGFLRADGTSLGADDGIALAYGLALLDSEDIAHPDLEVVFTVQEEVGLYGAEHFDCSDLKGKYLINIDTEQEGVFFTSCAGAVRADLVLPVERVRLENMRRLTVELYGLAGGHSGMEIHLGRPNAIVIMMRLLLSMGGLANICSIECDGKTNAIADHCKALLYVSPEKADNIAARLSKTVAEFNAEFEGVDEIKLRTTLGDVESAMCWTKDCHRSVLGALIMIPNGVIGMSGDIPGLVETSANPGILVSEDNKVTVSFCIRSSVRDKKEFVLDKLESVAAMSMGDLIRFSDYPQWEYRENSMLRDMAMDSYRELFGREPKASAIHAGLECGYFAERITDVDIISIGPDQFDVHTTRERVSLDSLGRVWQLIQKLLELLSR